METFTDAQKENVRLFTEDPNYGPDQIRYKAKTVRIFSEWLHLVSSLEIIREE